MREAKLPVFQQRLAQDLFDALWLEDLYGFRAHCQPAGDAWDIVLDEGERAPRRLRLFGIATPGLRPLRIGRRAPACLEGSGGERALAVAELATHLEQASWWRAPPGRLAEPFALACAQAAFAAGQVPAILARLRAEPGQLRHWEALASLRDRPFHPLARAKDWGAMPQAAACFGAEAGQPIALRWVAVARSRWVATDCVCPASLLLTQPQQARLRHQAEGRGIDPQAYAWLPMHPWQLDYWQRTQGWQPAAALDLDIGIGHAYATASLRTLAVQGRSDLHLKLPLSVPLLGATRSLPARYLHNGRQAQHCLAQLRRRDAWLAQHLRVCDESQSWAMRQHADALHDPGELACQLRRYPQQGTALLVPMAALPVVLDDGSLPAFDVLLGENRTDQATWLAFERIAALALELALRCFSAGTMPELHGQNLLLAWQDGVPTGAVLRDHDSLRICAPMMRASGLPVPDYRVAADSPNTLLLPTAEPLLAYLQTLLVEVNLYALLAAIAEHSGTTEAQGWQRLQWILAGVLERVALPALLAAEVRARLLLAPRWPFKQVLRPLLQSTHASTGMPAAMGTWPNPFLHCDMATR